MLKPIHNVDEARGIRLSRNESGDGGWFRCEGLLWKLRALQFSSPGRLSIR
jgi:hypothetical protein